MSTQDAEMADRTKWSKPVLQRLISLKKSGLANREILTAMQQEFGGPCWLGEIHAELHLLARGPTPGLWNWDMEERVKRLVGQGMDSKDITSELFHEYARPDKWQETYRKIQQMKMQRRIA